MFLLLMGLALMLKSKVLKQPKLKLGKMTIRKAFLTIGVISWIIGLMGCTKLGFGPVMGFGLIATTMFHGLILITVYRRKPLHRRIIERNVVDERISKA